MLLFRACVKPSSISGTGCYTLEDISEGEIVWEFTPEVDVRIDPTVVHRLPEAMSEHIRTYAFLDDDGMFVLCGDHAKFFNHSSEPNTINSPDGRATMAARDIAAGEELTCDYHKTDDAGREKLEKKENGPIRP